MSKSIISVRIFIASPNDVKKERDIVFDVINDLNRILYPLSDMLDREILLEAVGWEKIAPVQGVPNKRISEKFPIEECDIVIGIFWKKFGNPPGTTRLDGTEYSSGTEEELERAFIASQKQSRPSIMLYRKTDNPELKTSSDIEQYEKVTVFFKECEVGGKHPALYCEFKAGDFRKLIRDHLLQAISGMAKISGEIEFTKLSDLFSSIESELQKQVARLDQPKTKFFHEMLTYHMGWTGEGTTGKRIRPLLVMLSAAASGGDWHNALPAAAAVELIHQFSLIHDDIQDNSGKRMGRPTIWVKWGAPLAINTGDAVFVLANQAILDLENNYSTKIVATASGILQTASLNLLRGQFFDMTYKSRTDLGEEDYWSLIEGKTAALLSACCQIGSLLGGAKKAQQECFSSYGKYLGLAFQVHDDIIGIWGNRTLQVNSVGGDLAEGKNSLPVIIGLSEDGKFAARWKQGKIKPEEVENLADMLKKEGAYTAAIDVANKLIDQAYKSLHEAQPKGKAGQALIDLTDSLLNLKVT